MPATFLYREDNGAATGSPPRGATRTDAPQVNWKSVDNVATVPSGAPITAGQNSYVKYQFGVFSGTFSSISAGLWAHTAGILGTGLTLKGKVSSTYATPVPAADGTLTDMSAVTPIASGQAVLFSTVGPQDGSPSASIVAAGFSQYLITQLLTTGGAAAGNTATITVTLQYNET